MLSERHLAALRHADAPNQRNKTISTFRKGMPLIINDTDCPEAKLVAVLQGFDSENGAWRARYLSPKTNMLICWTKGLPTPLAAFGRRVELNVDHTQYRVIATGEPVTATYEDGKSRNWQDRSGREWWECRPQAARLLAKFNAQPQPT